MRRARREVDHIRSVDITPMIDVVFLLIVFFMTTAQFARLTRAEIDLPLEKGEQEREAERAGIVINLAKDGSFIVASERVDLAGVERIVQGEVAAAAGAATPVRLLIRADREADSAHLNELLDRLQRIGVGEARIGTEVPR